MPTPQLDAAAAGTWTLGDRTVNRIGFGTKRLAGSGVFDLGTPARPRPASSRLLRRAVELGVNHIDTAAFYPSVATPTRGLTASRRWTANELIREALAPYPDDL